MNTKTALLVLGLSSSLFACGKSSGRDFDSTNGTATSVSTVSDSQAMGKALMSTFNQEMVDPSGASTADIPASLVSYSAPAVGSLSTTVAQKSRPTCLSVTNTPSSQANPGLPGGMGDYTLMTSLGTFACNQVAGTIQAEIKFSIFTGSWLTRSTNLNIQSQSDTAHLDHLSTMSLGGGMMMTIIPVNSVFRSSVSISRVNDSFTIAGRTYGVVVDSSKNESLTAQFTTLAGDTGSGSRVNLSGVMNFSSDLTPSQRYVISSSNDLHRSVCGLDAGVLTLKSTEKQVDITFAANCAEPTIVESAVQDFPVID